MNGTKRILLRNCYLLYPVIDPKNACNQSVRNPLAACWYILKDNSILLLPCISVFRRQLRRSRQQLSACTIFLWCRFLTGRDWLNNLPVLCYFTIFTL